MKPAAPGHAFIWQKPVQRVAALVPVSWLLARTLHHVDRPLLRLSRGRLSLAGVVAGLPLVLLTTVGARSGRPRRTPLVALRAGDDWLLVASAYGRAHHPAWYHNLRANPVARVTVRGRTRAYCARELSGEDYDRCWQQAIRVYAGFAAYRRRAHRHIPLMLLSPV